VSLVGVKTQWLRSFVASVAAKRCGGQALLRMTTGTGGEYRRGIPRCARNDGGGGAKSIEQGPRRKVDDRPQAEQFAGSAKAIPQGLKPNPLPSTNVGAKAPTPYAKRIFLQPVRLRHKPKSRSKVRPLHKPRTDGVRQRYKEEGFLASQTTLGMTGQWWVSTGCAATR
jgi:hypothetical protein